MGQNRVFLLDISSFNAIWTKNRMFFCGPFLLEWPPLLRFRILALSDHCLKTFISWGPYAVGGPWLIFRYNTIQLYLTFYLPNSLHRYIPTVSNLCTYMQWSNCQNGGGGSRFFVGGGSREEVGGSKFFPTRGWKRWGVEFCHQL